LIDHHDRCGSSAAAWICIIPAQQPEKYAGIDASQIIFLAIAPAFSTAAVHLSGIQRQFGKSAVNSAFAKVSQGGMSIALLRSEFMQADLGGSPFNLVSIRGSEKANPSPFGTLFP
jgi:hypothetical protein